MNFDFAGFKPAVARHWLILMAGALWSIAGLMLCRLAVVWLAALGLARGVGIGAGGFLLAWIIYRRFFAAIASKNIDRLCQLADKSCIFGFQGWKSYFLVAAMALLGIVLRHSAIPRSYLAFCYMAMGGALLLSSFRYYARFWRVLISKQPCRSVKDNSR